MKSNLEKEIYEQPQILSNLLSTYIKGNQVVVDTPQQVDKVIFIASGSSFHCAKAACEMFTAWGNIDAVCEYSSEFPFKNIITNSQNILYVFLSQSGETTDTLAAINSVKAKGYKTLSIVNKENSTLWNLSDYNMYCNAGPENTIASTKALSAQLLCSYLLMLKLMQQQGKDVSDKLAVIQKLPQAIENIVFSKEEQLQQAGQMLSEVSNVAILGNQVFLAIAQEASLKIKETSFVNANSYPFGEFMHGHVALFNNPGVLIAFVNNENIANQTKFLEKIKSDYSPKMIVLSMNTSFSYGDLSFEITDSAREIQVFCGLIMCQLFALNCAKALGRDIDNPHGLTKVVV